MLPSKGADSQETLHRLFENLAGVPFFVKDADLRYVAVNRAMVRLCGAREASDLIGKRTGDFFPVAMAQRYEALDRQIFKTGKALNNAVELTVRAGRDPIWIVFSRVPLFAVNGTVRAVAAAGRIAGASGVGQGVMARVEKAAALLRADPAHAFDLSRLAVHSGVSASQLQRDFMAVFEMTPRAFLRKLRVEKATTLLQEDNRISDIAQQCGFADHSAFTRCFSAEVGMTPTAFRTRLKEVR